MLWLGLALAGVVVFVVNASTTRRLWRSQMFERSQKIAQTVLVWMLPGSFLVVRHLLAEPRPASPGDPTVENGTREFDLSAIPTHHGHPGAHD